MRRTAIWVTPEPGEAIRLPERPGTLILRADTSLGLLGSYDLGRRWLARGRSSRNSRLVAIDPGSVCSSSAPSVPSASSAFANRWGLSGADSLDLPSGTRKQLTSPVGAVSRAARPDSDRVIR